MNMRLFKKELKSRGLTMRRLFAFWEDFKKGEYIRKVDLNNTQLLDNPSSKAFIYKSELDFISRCILDYKNIETGGQLFGFWTADGSPVVLYAIGPGAKANHQVTFFNQDVDYLLKVGKSLVHHYGLQHIGEWHSHHKLGLAHPSGHDASTMADTIKEKRIPQFVLCIGNCSETESTLNPFNFTLNAGYNYTKAEWKVMGDESPYRARIDKELESLLIQPKTINPCYNMTGITRRYSEIKLSNDGYWFEDKQNRLILKNILDFLETFPCKGTCTVKMNHQNHIQLFIKRDNKEEYIYFPSKFPQVPPVIHLNNNGKSVHPNILWDFQGNILETFIKSYKSIYNYDGR